MWIGGKKYQMRSLFFFFWSVKSIIFHTHINVQRMDTQTLREKRQ